MTGNLFAGVPSSVSAELVEVLASAGPIRVERIISTGQASEPGVWYDQDEWEFVALIAGAARLTFGDGSTRELLPGDWLAIPPHALHRVEWTSVDEPTVWLAVFAPGD